MGQPESRTVELRDGERLRSLGVELVAVPVFRGTEPTGPAATVDGWLGGGLARTLREEAFRGEKDEEVFLPLGDPELPHVLAVGLGESPTDCEGLRRAAGRAVRKARLHRVDSLAFALPETPDVSSGEPPTAWVEAVAQGLVLGDWSLDELKSAEKREDRPRPPSRAVVHSSVEIGDGTASVRRGRVVAEAQNFVRDLVARPGNVVTPSHLASRAERMGREHGLEVDVWGPDRLREMGFGALLAVSRGSSEEPRLVVMRYPGSTEDPYVLVGKGVTFDSGGISLKPAKGMEEMKYDMAGGAAVMGTLRAVAELGLPLHVVGMVPATENLPSGSALKPADVIRGVSGKSVEVVNTDAEGRLILSDALAWAGRFSAAAVVDIATLTGGCVVALGRHAAGLMTDDEALAGELLEAGRRSGERLWRLPLWDEYRKQLDSEVADIKNSGGREASAITAGMFLKEFVDREVPWAHLDIAGIAWAEEEGGYQPEGATGSGVRLLVDWLLRQVD